MWKIGTNEELASSVFELTLLCANPLNLHVKWLGCLTTGISFSSSTLICFQRNQHLFVERARFLESAFATHANIVSGFLSLSFLKNFFI